MEWTPRQQQIIDIVKETTPITAEDIANQLGLARATIRPDLTILTMTGILGARPKVGYFYAGRKPYGGLEKEFSKWSVGERMSVPVILEETSSIYEATVEIFLEDVGTIFITHDGFLSGLVSRKDLLRCALGGMNLESTPIGVVMTRMPNLVTIHPDAPFYEAVKLLSEHNIDALPVVEEEDGGLKVLGRISKTNVTRLLAELLEKEEEA